MQGFNMGRYVPPEHEGLTSGNALNHKHPLGSRANKSSLGILTVRFEMPYAIWCTSCPKPTIIGQGVRFNAEKKKIGSYHTTPIFSFRMKHSACGGSIEIHTDPKNTAYVVHAGARARDTGEARFQAEQESEGGVPILTAAEREARRENAFASLEGKVADRARLERARERLEELQDVQDAQWGDPYVRNQKLRGVFREGRKAREREAGVAAELKERMSLGIELLPESEDDARRAALVDFGPEGVGLGLGLELGIDPGRAMAKVIAKPLFGGADTSAKGALRPKHRVSGKLKAEQLAAKRKADLAEEIRGNTRAKTDPFLVREREREGASKAPPWKALGVKRKRDVVEDENGEGSRALDQVPATGLVDYDSE